MMFSLEAPSSQFTWVLEPVLQGMEGGVRSLPRLAPSQQIFLPDLSRAQTEQCAFPRPVPASIVRAQRVKRTSCESIKCLGVWESCAPAPCPPPRPPWHPSVLQLLEGRGAWARPPAQGVRPRDAWPPSPGPELRSPSLAERGRSELLGPVFPCLSLPPLPSDCGLRSRLPRRCFN